ncbi:MAG: TonB-dependent receptor domain-containing protein [Leptonema sp. (in: bacteria)]
MIKVFNFFGRKCIIISIIKNIKLILIVILFNSLIRSEEYTILVKSKKDSRDPKKDVLTIDKNNFHYTLDKLLEKEGGIIIQKFGGEGSYSLVRIRGSNANQVQIYLDGIPLNYGSYSEVNLSDLQMTNYQSIQIQKNGIMPELSGSSIGGSINLIPNYLTDENQIFVQGGSYKTFGGGLIYSKIFYEKEKFTNANAKEEVSLLDHKSGFTVSLYKETSDQNYKFLNHNGTIYYNTLDDFIDIRKNAQYKKTSSMLTGFYKYQNTEIRFLNDSLYRLHGIPGPITKQTEKIKREHLRNTTGLFVDSKKLFWDFFNLNTRFFYTYINNNFKDPKNELAFGANSSSAFLHNKGFHFLPEFLIFESSLVFYKAKFFIGYEQEQFREDKYTSFGQKVIELPEKKRFHYSGHIYNHLGLWNGRIEILPEFRYEGFRNNFVIEAKTKNYLQVEELKKDESKIHFNNDSYQFIYNIQRKKNSNLKIFAKYNKEKRIPSFIELFGEKGSIVPNLKLHPELSFNAEMGIILNNKFFLMDIRGFQKKISDMIRFLPNSQFSLRAENIEKVKIKGGELTIKYKFKDLLQIYHVYQYMEAKKVNQRNFYQSETYIPLIPIHTAKSGISFFPERTLEFQIDFHYYGAFFRNESNDYFSYVSGKWLYNFLLYFRYQKTFLFFIEVRNLQNEWYEDIIGYPLPGRSYNVGLRYYF